MLKRSIPAGLDFTASGMPYWDTDIAGFFSPPIYANYHSAHKPLVDPTNARNNVDGYVDYPELFVRWFQWGAFQPVMRAHGERMHNEVWSYGKEAEPILEKYLRLRYELMPYIYSIAYGTYQTGAPFMRALFMDFPSDPKVSDIPDEYMFGPAFLVAPVTEQGATSRSVYLPAGSDWYNFWTNERVHGGQTITAAAPIDTIPIFGQVLLFRWAREFSARGDADFALFSDDGTTYGYEKGGVALTRLHWDEAKHSLTHQGPPAWSEPDVKVVHIVQP